jgi:hypothetical protein
MRWAGHVASLGGQERVHMVLAGRPEGKRPFGRPRHRWEDNIKMDLQDVGWGSMDCADLARIGKVACSCESGNEPSGFIKCGEFFLTS